MECDGCTEDYYRDPTATDTTTCTGCPEGAYCAGGTVLPVPLAGYWSNRSDLALVHHLHECPRGETVCVGGMNASTSTEGAEVVAMEHCWQPENLFSDECAGDTILCATGSVGPLCGAVEKGKYYWSSLTKALEACPEQASGNQWLTAVSLAVALVVAILIYVYQTTLHGWLSAHAGKCYTTPARVFKYATANGRSKVLWTNFQILISIPWTLDVAFPEPFNRLLDLLSFIRLDFLDTISASCVNESFAVYSNHVLFTSLIPLGLAAVIALIYAIRIVLIGRSTPEDDATRTSTGTASAQHVMTQHATAFLLLTYLVLPSVSMTQFRGLNCVEFESGHAYLRVDTSVWCDTESDDYNTLLGADVPLIILYQSIPILYAVLLFKSRRRLDPGFRNELAARRKRGRDKALAPLRFLFEDYVCGQWGFEIFDMWRRIAMVGLLPFAPLDYRPIIGCGLAAMSLSVFQEVQPYHDPATNALAVAAQVSQGPWQRHSPLRCALCLSLSLLLRMHLTRIYTPTVAALHHLLRCLPPRGRHS